MIGYRAMLAIQQILVNSLTGSGTGPDVQGRVFMVPIVDPERVPCVCVISDGESGAKVEGRYAITKPIIITGIFKADRPAEIETSQDAQNFEIWLSAIKSALIPSRIDGVAINYVNAVFFDPAEGSDVLKIEVTFNLVFNEQSPPKRGLLT